MALFYDFLICCPVLSVELHYYGRSFFVKNEKIAIPILITVSLISILLNFIRYHGKYDILSDRFKNETNTKRTWNGVFVVLALTMPIVLNILDAIYF